MHFFLSIFPTNFLRECSALKLSGLRLSIFFSEFGAETRPKGTCDKSLKLRYNSLCPLHGGCIKPPWNMSFYSRKISVRARTITLITCTSLCGSRLNWKIIKQLTQCRQTQTANRATRCTPHHVMLSWVQIPRCFPAGATFHFIITKSVVTFGYAT